MIYEKWQELKRRTCFPESTDEEYDEIIDVLGKIHEMKETMVNQIEDDMKPVASSLNRGCIVDQNLILSCLDDKYISVSPWIDVKEQEYWLSYEHGLIAKIEFDDANTFKHLKISDTVVDLDPSMEKSIIDVVLLKDQSPYTYHFISTSSPRIRIHYFNINDGGNIFSAQNIFTKCFRNYNQFTTVNENYKITYHCGCSILEPA